MDQSSPEISGVGESSGLDEKIKVIHDEFTSFNPDAFNVEAQERKLREEEGLTSPRQVNRALLEAIAGVSSLLEKHITSENARAVFLKMDDVVNEIVSLLDPEIGSACRYHNYIKATTILEDRIEKNK